MGAQITPTILAENTDDYKTQVERVTPFAERVHLDITDGAFAPALTVSVTDLWAPAGWTIDIHAMVQRPEDYVEQLIALRPNLIIFHAEAEGDILGCLQKIKAAGVKAGLALQRQTVPSTVAPLIEAADHVMIFSGNLGHFGGTASLMQLEKIRLIKAINAAVEIGWDGGVTIDNIYSLQQGGVNVLNVGGALQKASDPKYVFEKMVEEINKQAVI